MFSTYYRADETFWAYVFKFQIIVGEIRLHVEI